MSGSRWRDQGRSSDGAASEEHFESIEPADFRLPSPRGELLIENSSAEPLVRHLAHDDSSYGRGTRGGREPCRSQEHSYYNRSRQYPMYHRDDRRHQYRYHGHRRETGPVEQEPSDPYDVIRNVSSSAGESVTSQRHRSSYDAPSFDSQHPPEGSYYSHRPPSRYPTPPPAQHYHQQAPALATRLPPYRPPEDYQRHPRHPHPGHGSYFRTVEQVQQEDHGEADAIIEDINENDVICGRGGAANTHIGNRSFREFVKQHQPRYLTSKKKEKPAVAEFIVNYIKKLTPAGRFVKKDQQTGTWYEVSDERAREKASQALREGAAAIRRGEIKEGEYSQRSGSPAARSDGSNGSESGRGRIAKEDRDTRIVLEGTQSEREAIEGSTEDIKKSISALGGVETNELCVEHDPHESIGSNDDDSVSSGGSSFSVAYIKRVVIVQPALELKRQQLATVDVSTLSEEEKALYFDSFTPPTYSPSTVVSDIGQQV